MDKYLEESDLNETEIKIAIRKLTIAGEIIPMMCGTAFKNKGVQAMLDGIIEYLPSPVDIPPITGSNVDNEIVFRQAKDKEKFSALAFKNFYRSICWSIMFYSLLFWNITLR